MNHETQQISCDCPCQSGIHLGACASGGEQTATLESPAESPATTTQADTAHNASVSKGGQVVEAEPYHLELVTLKKSSGVHLDFYLQKGDTHEAIPDATVPGQSNSNKMTYSSPDV